MLQKRIRLPLHLHFLYSGCQLLPYASQLGEKLLPPFFVKGSMEKKVVKRLYRVITAALADLRHTGSLLVAILT